MGGNERYELSRGDDRAKEGERVSRGVRDSEQRGRESKQGRVRRKLTVFPENGSFSKVIFEPVFLGNIATRSRYLIRLRTHNSSSRVCTIDLIRRKVGLVYPQLVYPQFSETADAKMSAYSKKNRKENCS